MVAGGGATMTYNFAYANAPTADSGILAQHVAQMVMEHPHVPVASRMLSELIPLSAGNSYYTSPHP